MSKIEQLLSAILGLFTIKTVAPVFGSSTTTGTILECAKISFVNTGGANATITCEGTSYTLEPSEVIILEPGMNRRNEIITFVATGTTLKYILYR